MASKLNWEVRISPGLLYEGLVSQMTLDELSPMRPLYRGYSLGRF
jgi:hypothetical protein